MIANFCQTIFQSTLPRRERLLGRPIPIRSSLFQSTLPRRERPDLHFFLRHNFRISIHAPAKGATYAVCAMLGNMWAISIHAPAKGATISIIFPAVIDINFNPRSREGSDSVPGSARMSIAISIHAPAKGATPFSRVRFL